MLHFKTRQYFMQTIDEPKLPNSLPQVRKRQNQLKELVDKFSQHKSSKICKKIKYRQLFFAIGDFVLVTGVKERIFICRISNFFVFQDKIQSIPVVQLQWCLQKSDLKALQINIEAISDNEVFPSNRKVCQYITAVIDKCDVLDLQEYLCLQTFNKRYYFSRAKFDVIKADFVPPMLLWKKACICDQIPVPQENGKLYIFCSKCDKIFHRKCLNFYVDARLDCQQCCNMIQMQRKNAISIELPQEKIEGNKSEQLSQ